MFLVNLDDFDKDYVADVDDVGHFVDAFFAEFGDVYHSVLAGSEIDAGAELTLVVLHNLDYLAFVNITHFDVADYVLDDSAGLANGFEVVGSDKDGAFVVDVNLDAGLFDNLVYGLAAAADDVANLIGVNGERDNLGRPDAEFGASCRE